MTTADWSHATTLVATFLLPASTLGTLYIWWLYATHPAPRPKFWLMTSVAVSALWGGGAYLIVAGALRHLGLPTEWLPLGRAILAVVLMAAPIWVAAYVHRTRRQG